MSSTREDENRRNFLIRSCGGAASVAGLAVWFACAAAAQVSPTVAKVTHLEVSAANVDLNTHMFDVHLTNLSQKTIVAYTLEMRALDGSGKPLNVPPLVVGTDYAFNLV